MKVNELLKTSMCIGALAAMTGCAADGEQAHEAASGASQSLTLCPATNVIADPPQFQWTFHPSSPTNPQAYYSGTLEVGRATFNIGGQTLTTRAYRQEGTSYTIPGPTIKMAPGNKYVLRFHNTLPFQALSTQNNVLKDPNVANIHTHGLHISGEAPGDDVTRAFEGGRGGDFVYDIPDSHMGGTYWYHAHHHGSTFLQVAGGMFGQLIIDDANDGVPANVAAMPERQLVVAYLDPNVAGAGGDTLMSGTLNPTWTVNGLVQGALCMPQNEWQHWRILLTDRDATEKALAVGANCEVQLLARDGVWRTTAPRALTTRQITITGASRVDLAVRCSNDSNITVDGTTVANVLVSGNGNTTVGPFSNGSSGGTWSAIRPSYLRDLRGVTNVAARTVGLNARSFNGTPFNHDVPNFTVNANQVQAWTLQGSAQHPTHLHIYHMQAQNCGGDYENGEYYDVISRNCTVRFDMNVATTEAYEGRTIVHCHILQHEDQGAMGWMDVVGGIAPPTYPSDGSVSPPFSEYYTLSAGTTPACGDQICNGTETRCSCAGDCGAAPTTETSCTDGVSNDCDGAIDCADPDCASNAACAAAPACGDGTCNGTETRCSCPGDCGAAPTTETSCTDGVSDDCDAQVDCADADCNGNAACVATTGCDNDSVCEPGESCNTCAGDCAARRGGRQSRRYCCGDGVRQAAEGNGNVCDGNF